jgi:hypothetical protein
MTTLPFGPRNRETDSLLAKAAELPQDIAPARDLWPAIAARLMRCRARRVVHSIPPRWLRFWSHPPALLTGGLMREPVPAATGPRTAP